MHYLFKSSFLLLFTIFFKRIECAAKLKLNHCTNDLNELQKTLQTHKRKTKEKEKKRKRHTSCIQLLDSSLNHQRFNQTKGYFLFLRVECTKNAFELKSIYSQKRLRRNETKINFRQGKREKIKFFGMIFGLIFFHSNVDTLLSLCSTI